MAKQRYRVKVLTVWHEFVTVEVETESENLAMEQAAIAKVIERVGPPDQEIAESRDVVDWCYADEPRLPMGRDKG